MNTKKTKTLVWSLVAASVLSIAQIVIPGGLIPASLLTALTEVVQTTEASDGSVQ